MADKDPNINESIIQQIEDDRFSYKEGDLIIKLPKENA
jgi:hypothetical protein